MFFFLYGASYVHAANIAVIKSESIKPYDEALKGFKSVIGGNIKEYDLRNDINKSGKIISQVISQQPDLVYTIGTKASWAAGKNIERSPIVFSMVSRPEKYGLNRSNIAGVSINIPTEVQFRFLKEMMKNVFDLPPSTEMKAIYKRSLI